jgi:diaminohydroxyphosphoribosylaminopyrimidine deaminase/5-amino-6-(5-phosphoribosylamino)uracil reductase
MRLFSDVASRVHDPYLAHAAALAERARGRAWPNPLVGCVVVRDGRIVGEGFHPRAGLPHAEIFALADAGAAAQGADVYVTLEPCAHHGKTPPCVNALIAAGVSKVVIGMPDPNAEAAGGAEMLLAAGITVGFVEDATPFAEINTGWLRRLETGMPFVTAKSGLSLDARIAFTPGERASMTGPSGAEVTRRLRAGADAVMVSAATVAADDPALTVRDGRGRLAEDQPLRLVLVRKNVPSADARMFTDGRAPTLVLASDEADSKALASLPTGVSVARWNAADGLRGALRALGKHGIGNLLIEPGSRLLSALWDADLVDEYVTVTAGGMAGNAPAVFIGMADQEGDTLKRRMKPREAGIVGDVSVTVWGAHERLGD